MSDQKIPKEIQEFLIENIESVGQLEVLARILKDPKKTWTAEDLRSTLHSSHQAIEQHLKRLIKIGAVSYDSQNGEYLYRPIDDRLNRILTALNSAYTTFPARVIEIVYNKSDQVLRDFVDAFKLRKDRKDG